jgi:hypothetical protein
MNKKKKGEGERTRARHFKAHAETNNTRFSELKTSGSHGLKNPK